MKLIRSKVLGFCMGVRRAVALTEAEVKRVKESGGRVFTLGPLIHNPEVLSDLKNSGVEILDKPLPPNLENCSVVIRAHGIAPNIENDLRSRGARIIDATCPKVKASQLKVEELVRSGCFVFLAGEADHAEIEGILGYADFDGGSKKSCAVVSNAEEARTAAKKLYEADFFQNAANGIRTALVGQTTISLEEYNVIADAIKKYFPAVEVIQTICSATKERQQALRELLSQVEAVIIAGGKESANTRRLFAIAEESGKPCLLAETAAEIPSAFRSYKKVGLSAGASTPDSVIDKIEQELLR